MLSYICEYFQLHLPASATIVQSRKNGRFSSREEGTVLECYHSFRIAYEKLKIFIFLRDDHYRYSSFYFAEAMVLLKCILSISELMNVRVFGLVP